MNPRQPINESVQSVLREEKWTLTVNEASLNRVLKHLTGQDVTPDLKIGQDANWAILTSYRKFHNPSANPAAKAKDDALAPGAGTPSETKSANRVNFNSLVSTITNLGYGAIRLSGAWEEKGKASQHKNDPFERSILIPGKPNKATQNRNGPWKPLTLEFVKRLGLKYNQDGIIYAGPDAEKPGEAALYRLNQDRTAYEFDFSLGKVGIRTPQQIEKALAEVRKGEREFFPVSVPGGSGVKANFEPDAKPADRKTGFAFEAIYERLGIPACSLVIGHVELNENDHASQRTRWCDNLDDSPASYGKML